jgi:tetratricopeptide (TPR) repeat protein
MMTRCSLTACAAVLLMGCAASQGQAPEHPRRGEPAPSSAALFARGQAFAKAGDSTRAEEYMMLAVREGYPEQQAVLPIVRVCAEASRFQAALDHALPFLRRHPHAWRLRIVVASLQAALDRPAEAAAELRRVIIQQPAAAPAHYQLGVLQRDAFRDRAAARRSFQAYLRHDREGRFAPEVAAWLAEQRSRRDSLAALQRPARSAEEARP